MDTGKELQDRVIELQQEVLALRMEIAQLKSFEKDEATGVYTREAFLCHMEETIEKHSEYSVVMSDMEHYKHVVDRYGVEYVDGLLKKIGQYLMSIDEACLVGRYGVDRFVILLPKAHLSALSQKQQEMTDIRNELNDKGIHFKFGIVTEVDTSVSAAKNCDHAFTALRMIKHQFGKTVKYFDESVEQQVQQEVRIEEEMQNALEDKQFRVYYQPKTDVHTGKIAGAEALVRWINPELGFMNPGVFIPLFERNGFITTLDRYIWSEVCEVLSERLKKQMPVVPISINVSRKDFDDNNLVEGFTEMVDSYQIPHHLIHIEVTESSYADKPERVSYSINTLHENGFIIELDDFGTGYTSLSSLHDMTLDILKVDMSLLNKDDLSSDKSVLSFAFQLAKMMELKTVQEGVETEEQNERMKNLDCDYIQGFYYSKPLPREEFGVYIDEHI